MIFFRQVDSLLLQNKPLVGTTAEIRSFKYDQDEDSGFTLLRVLAEGSQRFCVEESWRQADGYVCCQ